jgi:hypothetical protein
MKGRSLSYGKVGKLINKSKANYLEIGCFDGINICEIASIAPEKLIYGIDPFISDSWLGVQEGIFLSEQKNNLYDNISYFNNIKFYELTSEQFRNSHTPNDFKNLNIDFVYIDGAHIYDFIIKDIHIALECIMNNSVDSGIILFDDLHIPDVVKAMSYFENLLYSLNIKFDKNTDSYFIKK